MPYKQPSPISPYPMRCYCIELPDKQEYRAAFIDSIMELTRWWNWKHPDNRYGKEIAAYLNSVLVPQLQEDFMCCCDKYGDAIALNLANLQYALTLIAKDTGTVASFAPDAPDTSFSSDTGDDTSDKIQQRKNALCDAVRSYMAVELHYWANLVNATFALEGALALLLSPIPILGVTVGATAGLTKAAFDAIISNPEAISEAICALYDGLLADDITLENFQTAVPKPIASETELDKLKTWLWGANQKTENYHAFVAFLGQAYENATPSIDDGCNCGGCFLYADEMPNWEVTTGTPDGVNVVGVDAVGYVIARDLGTPAIITLASWEDMSTGDDWGAIWHVVYKLGGSVVRDHVLYNQLTDHYSFVTYSSDSNGLVADRIEFHCDIFEGSGVTLTAKDFEVCT